MSNILTYVLDDGAGRVQTFKFGGLGLKPTNAVDLKRAFEALFVHQNPNSQKQSWASTRKFALFLAESAASSPTQLPDRVGFAYREWLDRQLSLGSATKGGHLNVAKSILEWWQFNAPETVSPSVEFFNLPWFGRQSHAKSKVVTEETARKVVAICYDNIERTEERLALGARLRLGQWRNEGEKELSTVLQLLLVMGKGKLCTQKVLQKAKNSLSRRVNALGGLRKLTSLLWITPTSLLDFYLPILIQSSGNPHSIANLDRRKCISQHPIRSDVEYLNWTKPRARKQQFVEFPTGKAFSATNLVRRLLSLNENLLPFCGRKGDRDKVFLSINQGSSALPCTQQLHSDLKHFIAENDLPPFTFKSFRSMGAAMHLAVGGDISVPQSRLNHAHPGTTVRYSENLVNTENNDKKVAKMQRSLVEVVRASATHRSGTTSEVSVAPAQHFETLFGFGCKDPFAGTAPHSHRGSMCQQFQQCATCPGAIVVVDDLRVVSQIVQTHEHLCAERKRSVLEGWSPRFDRIYSQTLETIEAEIIPAIAPALLARVKSERVVNRLPSLE